MFRNEVGSEAPGASTSADWKVSPIYRLYRAAGSHTVASEEVTLILRIPLHSNLAFRNGLLLVGLDNLQGLFPTQLIL